MKLFSYRSLSQKSINEERIFIFSSI